MDFEASTWAEPQPQLARISTANLPVRDRAGLLTDELGPRLSSGRATELADVDTAPSLEWLNVDLGGGLVLADVSTSAFDVAKSSAMARAGDDDCSLFVALTEGIRFEQNDRRERLGRGDGLFVAHTRAVRSWYADERMIVVRLPRSALPTCVAIESAGGLRVDAAAEAMILLRQYLATVMQQCEDGKSPSAMARRHVTELAAAAVVERLGDDDKTAAEARSAARLERMLGYVAQYYSVPGLSMREVAAAAGVAQRTGYSLFAAAGIDFTERLIALRLDHAYELLQGVGRGPTLVIDIALAVGFSDLSHFNRRFRQRFGCTPREVREAS